MATQGVQEAPVTAAVPTAPTAPTITPTTVLTAQLQLYLLHKLQHK